jgi:hypothetical protein
VRPRIGDIIEFLTPKGYAYAHYTHKHPRYGALLRVISGQWEDPLTSFQGLVLQSPQFVVFFPLGAACARRIVRIAGGEAVPECAQGFPTFRVGVVGKDGCVRQWWLWDGTHEWRADCTREELQEMPIRGIVNDTMLIQRICDGWTTRHVPVV